MKDEDLIALNMLQEASGESVDGKAAITRVVKNRMALHFQSDGTVAGTVLKKDQFSWAYFEMVNSRYTRVAHTVAEATARAEMLLSKTHSGLLIQCKTIAANVMAGVFRGPLYDHLTDDAVNYLNPRIIPHLPAWANADKVVCIIGHHTFYRN